MEITQKKKPPGSLDNLHPGIEPQSTFLYLSGYFIMKLIIIVVFVAIVEYAYLFLHLY